MLRSRRLALIIGTSAVILLLGVTILLSLWRRSVAEGWTDHTYRVIDASEEAITGLVIAESAQRGYLLTGLDPYLDNYNAGLAAYDSAAQQLRRLIVDNVEQQRRLDTLQSWVGKRRGVLSATLRLRDSLGVDAAIALFQTGLGKRLMDSVRRVAADLSSTERALLAERQIVESRRSRGVYLIAGLGMLAGVGMALVQGGLLSRALSTQQSLSDELADRAHTLEEVAGELEMSNEELQSSNDQLQTTLEDLQKTTDDLASSNRETELVNEQLDRHRVELEARNSELGRAVSRFRTLVDSLPAPLFVCRASGDTIYVNPAWTRLTGVPAETAVAEGWYSTVHADERSRVAEAWREVLAGRRAEVQYRHVRADGSVRHVRTTFEPVHGDAGTTDILGMGLDLTERLEHEEQLRHAQRMQAVGRLAGGMAHELNNMLTASIGFAIYAMRRLTNDHPAAPDIAESLKAQERAARVTSQVLTFSRRQMLAPTRFDVREAVEDLLPLLRQSLDPGQSLRTEWSDDAVTVHLDRTRLDQAIINLTLNARDAMRENGTLTLRTRRASVAADELVGPEGERVSAGEYAVIVLSDDGTGMDSDTKRRALEPFFTTKPVGQGTGLGLSMAYGFVRQSGGTLAIESARETGTSVSLYLPAAPAAVPAEPGAPTEEPQRASRRSEHVLIVDDEPSVRGTMRRALEEYGFKVHEAMSGAEALVRLDEVQGGIHLVVCDLVMPHMSGEALGRTISDRWPGLPILYVSGFPGADGMEGMMPVGAPFLKKPFSPEALAARVRSMLGSRDTTT